VRRNVECKEATNKSIEGAMREWFRTASDRREGGAKGRGYKKPHKAQIDIT